MSKHNYHIGNNKKGESLFCDNKVGHIGEELYGKHVVNFWQDNQRNWATFQCFCLPVISFKLPHNMSILYTKR